MGRFDLEDPSGPSLSFERTHDRSEGAPVPVPRDTLGRLDALLKDGLLRESHRDRRCGGVDDGEGSVRFGLLSLRGGEARVAAPPILELRVTVRASAAHLAPGVEADVLVERDLEAAVVVAEDVAALATVVAACKVGEETHAGRILALVCFMIRLEHFMSARFRDEVAVLGIRHEET